jgi:2-polyprenyl-3-methyl-5-hydroxy-6-metoxy-1,4-benzoquinol methylase
LNDNLKILYGQYCESCYKHSNILIGSEYEKVSKSYEEVYKNVLPEDLNAKILDIGCGLGHFLYFLSKKGYKNYLGIDISEQNIDYCKKNISKNVALIDACDYLENVIDKFDLIVAHDLLEHIPKHETLKFLQLVFNALKKNALLTVRVPNMSNPFSLDSRYRDFTHENGFTEKSLYQVLWVSGFREIHISSTKIPVKTFRNKIRKLMVKALHKIIKFLYYIQDYSVPKNLGKNLIVLCKK